MSLATKALGKAERMCKRPQSHCLLQQQPVYIRLFQLMSTSFKNKVGGHIKQCLCKNQTKKTTSGANPLATNTHKNWRQSPCVLAL